MLSAKPTQQPHKQSTHELHLAVTLNDVMMMYSKERYMQNDPRLEGSRTEANHLGESTVTFPFHTGLKLLGWDAISEIPGGMITIDNDIGCPVSFRKHSQNWEPNCNEQVHCVDKHGEAEHGRRYYLQAWFTSISRYSACCKWRLTAVNC